MNNEIQVLMLELHEVVVLKSFISDVMIKLEEPKINLFFELAGEDLPEEKRETAKKLFKLAIKSLYLKVNTLETPQ